MYINCTEHAYNSIFSSDLKYEAIYGIILSLHTNSDLHIYEIYISIVLYVARFTTNTNI